MLLSKKLGSWILNGGQAILDQGLLSGSNFAISIVLARWLMPEEYGTYAIALSLFLLLVMLYQSLVLEPMTIFGAAVYRGRLREYLRALMSVHLHISLAVFVSLGVWSAAIYGLGLTHGTALALCGVAFAGPSILLLWLLKRVFYLQYSPSYSLASAAIYCAFALTSLRLAYSYHELSVFSALLLNGCAALVASVPLIIRLNVCLPRGNNSVSVRETWARHWRYGKWALVTYCMMWLPANIFFPLLSSFFGPAQAGQLKALTNFAAPLLQAYAALSLLLLPYVADTINRKNFSAAASLTWQITALCLCGAICYWGLILIFKDSLFHVLYSGRYVEVMNLLPVVAIGSICWSVFFGPAITLRAMESPASVSAAALVSSIISLAIGVPATKSLGLRGAVWTMALSEALSLAVIVFLLSRKMRAAPRRDRARHSKQGTSEELLPTADPAVSLETASSTSPMQ